jgi:hypothetical protein
MTQHTPGPWQFKIDSSGEVPTDREIVICFYDRGWDDLPHDGAYAICTVHDTGEDGDGGLANARLIAAAPEMQARIDALEAEKAELLEALKSAVKWFEDYAAGHVAKGDADKAKRNQDRAAACRAAIAKAEGGGG